jgi:nicotinamide riboside kinase
MGKKINIALAGGPCTGKTTLAANLFSTLKNKDFDYDLIQEECRKLKSEFGDFRSPFERFYMWRQQEREELRSTAENGFITDKPLFHYYVQARQYSSEPRDNMAVRELFRMCLEIQDRYQLIIMAEDPFEIKYRKDSSRSSEEEVARERHGLIRSFVEHFWIEKLFFVKGDLDERMEQAMKKIKKIHKVN